MAQPSEPRVAAIFQPQRRTYHNGWVIILGNEGDITNMVHRCSPCQLNRSKPALAPAHPWVWPTHVWLRIHIDFAGPFLGHVFLLVVNSHSKWLEVEILPIKVSSERIILCLRSLFARYGLPDQLVSDSGPQFVSHVFKQLFVTME